MIIGRRISIKDDLYKAKSILFENNIDDDIQKDDIIYVLEDNNEVIGLSKVDIINNKGVLKYIVIDESVRGEDLGDGLLRATFNFCHKLGISTIYYSSTNSYLIKKGFVVTNTQQTYIDINSITFDDKFLKCSLESFFLKGCKSKRR